MRLGQLAVLKQRLQSQLTVSQEQLQKVEQEATAVENRLYQEARDNAELLADLHQRNIQLRSELDKCQVNYRFLEGDCASAEEDAKYYKVWVKSFKGLLLKLCKDIT